MLPLEGVRVVELGQVLSGPFAGAVLADLGADVVKVERPAVGDDARQMGPAFRDGASMTFHDFNRGKRSVVLDLKDAGDVERLHGLLRDADILVHNLRPGAAEDLGIGPDAVTARHPRLIYCAMGAFGHRGPLSRRPGYEPLLQAFGGLSSITGEPDGPPVRMGASVVDQGTGMWTVIGALAALRQREATGRGCVVNTSLFETALLWAGQKISGFVNQGEEPQRHASGHAGFVPYQAFEAADGPFLLCCGNDRLFAKLARDVGREDWIADPRFATNRARIANKEALLPELAEILVGRSRGEWLARFEAADIPCAPINSIAEVMREPQTGAVGMRVAVPGGNYTLTGLPISFDGERPPVRARAPRLGEHDALLEPRALAAE